MFENGKDEKPSDNLLIFPLAAGNTWVYLDSTYRDQALTLDSALLSISGPRVIQYGGQTDTVWIENALRRFHEPPPNRFNYLKNGSQGLHTRGHFQDSVEFLDNVLHVKYPAITGERYPTWFLSFRSEGESLVPIKDTLEIEVVNADTICPTPAGTFACVHYRGWRPGNVLHADSWYAPGIGWLGSETTRSAIINDTIQIVRTRRVLKSYVLN